LPSAIRHAFRSRTAEDAEAAKEKKSFTAKDAEDAKVTLLSAEIQDRDDNAKGGIKESN